MHLIRRFFGFLCASPLSPSEQQMVTDALASAELQDLFFLQAQQDQRHAFDVATRVDWNPDLVQAALLHDVGKADLRMGAVERSVATLWSLTSLPVWGRWQRYLDHGTLGAAVLRSAGADPLAVAFTAIHPGRTPQRIDRAAWHRLEAADDA